MGKTAGETRQVSRTSLPSFQQPYFEGLLQAAKSLYETGGPKFFPGNTVAGFAPAEEEAFRHIERAAPLYAGYVQDYAFPALTSALRAPDVANNPYVSGMAQAATRQITQGLLEQALPELRQGAVSTGNRGSTRESLASAQAVERAARAVGDTTANIYGNAYNSGLNAMISGLQLLPTVGNALFEPAYQLSSVGESQRSLEQARINEAIARFTHEQNLPWQTLSEYANLISFPGGGQSEVTVTGTPPSSAQQWLGGGLAILSQIPNILNLLRMFGLIG
jgi:hypothetical protein